MQTILLLLLFLLFQEVVVVGELAGALASQNPSQSLLVDPRHEPVELVRVELDGRLVQPMAVVVPWIIILAALSHGDIGALNVSLILVLIIIVIFSMRHRLL